MEVSVSRACSASLAIVTIVAVLGVAPSQARPVIGPGHEALFQKMGDLGPRAPADARLTGVSIVRDAVVLTYVLGDRSVVVRLVHPDAAPEAHARTQRFALVPEGDVPADLIATLAAQVKALESRFEWATEATPARAHSGTGPVFAPSLPEDATPFDLLPDRSPALPSRAAEDIRDARELLARGKGRLAARKASGLARKYPEDPVVLGAVASVLRAAGHAREALTLTKKMADMSAKPPPKEVGIALAASLLVAGLPEEAHAVLANLSDAIPPECAWTEVLSVLAREGRLDVASAHAPRAEQGAPRCVHVFRVKLAHALDDDAGVDAAADAGLRAFPDDESLLYLWGYHYYAKRAMERAIGPWERLVAKDLRFPALLGQLGTAYLVAQRLDRKGVDRMLERLAQNPEDLVASFLAGLGLYYLKEYERVVPLLEPVVKVVPDESRARLYLAMAHYFLGHQETAEQMFEDMEPYAYHDPDIYYCRSLIYRKRDLPRAIREMERFLEVFVGEGRLSFGPEKVQKARSDLERMRRGEVPELNLPGDPLVPAR